MLEPHHHITWEWPRGRISGSTCGIRICISEILWEPECRVGFENSTFEWKLPKGWAGCATDPPPRLPPTLIAGACEHGAQLLIYSCAPMGASRTPGFPTPAEMERGALWFSRGEDGHSSSQPGGGQLSWCCASKGGGLQLPPSGGLCQSQEEPAPLAPVCWPPTCAGPGIVTSLPPQDSGDPACPSPLLGRASWPCSGTASV